MPRLNHVNDKAGLIAMASLFSATAILAVTSRFYARNLLKAGLRRDDWFALVSMFFVLACNGIFIAGTVQGAITGHSPVVDGLPISTELEELAQKYKYAFQVTEKVTFGLIKISILFLWNRIFGRNRKFKIFGWVMIGVTSAWTIAFALGTLFQCGTHWSWNWAPIFFFLTQCSNTLDMLTVFTATDLATDFIIMFMPVPMIWKLNMPRRKKLGVTSIFMVGLFTIGAGIARMFTYLVTSYQKELNPDFIADFTLFILWSEIEVNVAMIVCCMPILGPVVGRFIDACVPLVRYTGLSKWSLLSAERSGTKKSNFLSQADTIPLGLVTADGTRSNIAANQENQLEHAQGIMARTEIIKTYEERRQ